MSVGKGTLALGLVAFAVTVTLPASAQNDEPPKWGPHIDLEGKFGNQRHLGEADLFIPALQNDRSLLFANIRSRADNKDSYEGNFGLGARHMLEAGWNLGVYGYFDRRRTENDGLFNQVTVGTEALGVKALGQDWDARVNGYIPVGRKVRLVDSLSTATVDGARVIFRGGEEHSMAGFDAELGWRVPVTAPDSGLNLRLYGGGYRFWSTESSVVPDVQGPRGRAELVFDQIPVLWEGSRFSLGAEGQSDAPRGPQAFVTARLRIPLQVYGSSPSKLTTQERRMKDPIVRDIDIVSQAGALGTPETATQTAGGSTLTVVSSSTTTGANLQTALTNAGANSTVILSGTFTPANNTSITLQTGQTVMGSGSLTVRSPSGRTATLTRASGATITTTFTANGGIVAMENNSTLTGVTLNQYGSGAVTPYGINADGKTGVTIANNTIYVQHDQNAAYGAYLLNGASGTISGNSITVRNLSTSGGTARGIRLADSSSAKIINNTISSTSDSGAGSMSPVFITNSAIYQSGSTGNTFQTSGGCEINSGGTTGTLYYTNSSGVASTCP